MIDALFDRMADFENRTEPDPIPALDDNWISLGAAAKAVLPKCPVCYGCGWQFKAPAGVSLFDVGLPRMVQMLSAGHAGRALPPIAQRRGGHEHRCYRLGQEAKNRLANPQGCPGNAAAYAAEHGEGWPDIGQLAEETELSVRTVRNALRELVAAGIIDAA